MHRIEQGLSLDDYVESQDLDIDQYEKEIFETPFTTHQYGMVRIFELLWIERKERTNKKHDDTLKPEQRIES